ncbi:MAG: MiaB/RimO family radical SAM methylthiotransferase [Patescibacteria group bacterium]|nr:MiaB/RimO family radical SAM methylthiotransferase [Patescibacteria group bacterium]
MKYHIITYGCQMNESDSERVSSFFQENGLLEGNEEEADVIIFTACSIRQSAIDRVIAKGKEIKEKKKKPVTILTGCVLKEDKKSLSSIFDYILDINDLPHWPLPFLSKSSKQYFEIVPKRNGISAYISIMTGCDNFCTYCVVPYTRGRVSCRPTKEVLKEVEDAVKEGHKEIWFLGQNVNAYKEELTFGELLKEADKIKGDFWIRFTSSHPNDFTDDMIDAMKNCKKVTNYLNLPVQSGNDEILKKMNRPYNISEYKKIIKKVKEEVPDVFISTDVIIGFPGETEKHFRSTLNLFNELLFDMIYIGRYSPRKQTAAYKMKETVSPSEKKRREKVLNELLKENNLEKNKKYIGKKLKVLVTNSTNKGVLVGKTKNYKSVSFKGSKKLIGSFVNVKINNYSPWGLKGVKIS